ncbi:MAG: PilZ domain-containing protein [Pyrinomonadaceae bacterium]|jgi:hypothetical protein
MTTALETPVQTIETSAEATMHAVVKGREEDGTAWKEVAKVSSVSATGAGFYLQRPCTVGTLLSLMIPLPPQLRSYDHDKEIYRVWGLVQHSQPVSGEDAVGYHIGVAFTGKHQPESYKENPSQSYKICGMSEDGLWRITESRSPFKARRHIRYWVTIELYLATVGNEDDKPAGERTTTENISKSGAAVFSTLDLNVGDRVKFICEKFDYSGLAVVCNRNQGPDGRMRLHLQFVDNMFPVERLKPQKPKVRD